MKQGFQDTLNLLCSCRLDAEASKHLFLYGPLLSNQSCTLLSVVNDTDSSLRNINVTILTLVLLFEKASLDTSANTLAPKTISNYFKLTDRFKEILIHYFVILLHILLLLLLLSFFLDYTLKFHLVHMHEIFLQFYCMKWVPGDPQNEMLNYIFSHKSN